MVDEVIFTICRILNSDTTSEQIAKNLTAKLAEQIRCDYIGLFSLDKDNTLHLLADHTDNQTRHFLPQTFPAHRLASQTVQLNRVLNLQRTNKADAPPDDETVPAALLGIPCVHKGQILGILLAGRGNLGQVFLLEERALLERLADLIALWLETYRVQTITSGFVGYFMDRQEDERRKLGEQISTEIAGQLADVRKNLQLYLQRVRPPSATNLIDLEKQLQDLIGVTKRLNQELRVTNLNEFGFSAALRQYIRDLPDNPKARCRPLFRLEGGEAPRLESRVAIGLFRACQEALDWACQQSDVSRVEITVRVNGEPHKAERLEIELVTNASNFIAAPDLVAIQERIVRAGATYDLKTTPPGLAISYNIPVVESHLTK